MKKNFSSILKGLRGDLSQQEIANKLGVAQRSISNWELGLREPDLEMLKKISALFGVTIGYLLNAETPAVKPSEKSPAPAVDSEDYFTSLTSRVSSMEEIIKSFEGVKTARIIDMPKIRLVPVVGMAAALSFDPSLGHIGDLWEHADERAPCMAKDTEGVFAIKISGDSMEPTLYDGDTVFISERLLPATGDICVAMLRGEGMVCKKWYWKNGVIKLESINPNGKSWQWTKAEMESERPIIWRYKAIEFNRKRFF